MDWQAWMAAGVILAIAEIFVPGFVLLGFAVGSVLTGCLVWAGLIGASLSVSLFVFAVASLAGWGILRLVFGKQSGHARIIERDINDND